MRLIGLAVVLALCLTIALVASEAQQPAQRARVGLLSTGGSRWRPPSVQGFLKRMTELGWIEGQNVEIEFSAEGTVEQLPRLAEELAQKVDIIVAPGNEFTLKAARQATTTIPIVMIAIDYDPLARGYVASLARPGQISPASFSSSQS